MIISHTGLETSHPPMDNHGRLTENVYSQPVVTISLKERAAPKHLPVATVSLALCKGSEWLETEHVALPVQPKSCRRCNCYSSFSRLCSLCSPPPLSELLESVIRQVAVLHAHYCRLHLLLTEVDAIAIGKGFT